MESRFFSNTFIKLFPLHNRSFFWLLVLSLVAALTFINNYYFYEFKNYQVEKQHRVLLSSSNASFKNCMRLFSKHDACEELIRSSIRDSSWPANVTTFKHDESIANFNNQAYIEDRKSVITKKAIENSQLTIEINQKSSPDIWASVIRSMTFSAWDILSLHNSGSSIDDIKKFIDNVAIPRSRPFFFYFIFSFSVFWLTKKYSTFIIIKLESQEKEIAKKKEDIHRQKMQSKTLKEELRSTLKEKQKNDTLIVTHETKLKTLTAKLNNSKSKTDTLHLKNEIARLKSKLGSASDHNRHFAGKISEIEDRLRSKNTEIDRLNTESEELRHKILTLEGRAGYESSGFKKRILKILLSNPDIPQGEKTKSNKGMHHSKDFVGLLTTQINENHKISQIIKSVTSAEYQPRKRGKAIIKWNEKKKGYALQIIDNNDEGFAAELLLTATTHWQAVIETKAIIATVPLLAAYEVEDKAA